MRDPDRIDNVLAAVKAYWKTHPDMRLGQVVYNAARMSPSALDVFNLEEDQLLYGLARLTVNEHRASEAPN